MRGQVDGMRKTIKNIPPFSDSNLTPAPVRPAVATQQNERSFFIVNPRAKRLPRQQTPDKETHPFPTCLLASKLQEFAAPARVELVGMDKKVALRHIVSCNR